MRFVWSSASKDIRRRLRDPLSVLIWIGIPFVILSLLTLAFGRGSDVKPQAHLLIVDEDDTFLSEFLVGSFGQGPVAEMFRVELVEHAEGHERINAGDGSGLLIIPEGFSSAVFNETPVTLKLLTNPSQRILPGIIEETLTVLVDGTFYIQRVLGGTLKDLADGPPEGATTFSNEKVAAISVTINELVKRVDQYLFPPVIQLETEVEVSESEPGFNFGGLFFQSMFFMSLLFMAGGLSDDVWSELDQGTLRRVVSSPQTLMSFLGGKLLAGGFLFGLVSLLAIPAGCWLFGFGLSHVPLAIPWAVFSGIFMMTIYTLLMVYSPSQRAANIVRNAVTFPLMFIGGSFFPFEVMPDWLANIGRWTPNGWALQQFKAILGGEAEVGPLAGAFIGLALLGAVLFLISARRVRRRFVLV